MLQPAISYGPLGSLQTEINKLTSVESGFTLLRCDGGGVSGAFDQYHRTHTQKMTRPNNDSLVMSVPLFGRSRTAFALWGNLLGWVCVVIALLWLVLVTLLHFKGYNRFSYQFRTFLESLDAHFGNHPQ